MLEIKDIEALPDISSKDWEDATFENIKENDILATSDGREGFPSLLLKIVRIDSEKDRLIVKFLGESRPYQMKARELRVHRRYKRSEDLDYEDVPVKVRICAIMFYEDGLVWPCHGEREDDEGNVEACLVLYESDEKAIDGLYKTRGLSKIELVNLDTDNRRTITGVELKRKREQKRKR